MMKPQQLPDVSSWPRRVQIIEMQSGSLDEQTLNAELDAAAVAQGISDEIRTAKPLREWRELLSPVGDVAEMTGPDGRNYRFTLAPWRDSDPDATLLRIGIVQYNPAIYGPAGPPPAPWELPQ